MRSGDSTVTVTLVFLLAAVLTGCGPDAHLMAVGQAPIERSVAAPSKPASSWAVTDPGPLRGKLLTADVLVVGDKALPRMLSKHVGDVDGVRLATPLAVASIRVADRAITVAAVDAVSYRRFTDEETAEMDAVWQALARGDAIISHQIGEDLDQPLGGSLALRKQQAETPLRIGAYATTVPHIDAVVNEARGTQLGMRHRNGLLISVVRGKLTSATDAIREVLGTRAHVQPLTPAMPRSGTRQAAYLTGGAVAQAVGSFSYRYFADGTVQPEAGWVAANIRTESVPILGRVTCHRVMLPQLRAALEEITRRGLAGKINPADYGGCYVPRFIGHDPQRGLSLHTWGIAIDLNVAGNQRGTVGEIDRDVVAIFKRWGFAWGGDWQWTDPMHFELAALVGH